MTDRKIITASAVPAVAARQKAGDRPSAMRSARRGMNTPARAIIDPRMPKVDSGSATIR